MSAAAVALAVFSAACGSSGSGTGGSAGTLTLSIKKDPLVGYAPLFVGLQGFRPDPGVADYRTVTVTGPDGGAWAEPLTTAPLSFSITDNGMTGQATFQAAVSGATATFTSSTQVTGKPWGNTTMSVSLDPLVICYQKAGLREVDFQIACASSPEPDATDNGSALVQVKDGATYCDHGRAVTDGTAVTGGPNVRSGTLNLTADDTGLACAELSLVTLAGGGDINKDSGGTAHAQSTITIKAVAK